MIQVTAQTRIWVAIEPADFRCGIDGLARRCRSLLSMNPMSGALFVFCNRKKTSIKILGYDGQGYWCCQKRLSQGRFRYWPSSIDDVVASFLAHELLVLLSAGDPSATKAAPLWKQVG